ncbi:hypothetical protein [Acidovorax sp. NCPPB 4044]|uniref:hypothetical protein n=1 Tax=Acidovorax sp. NCPPB 4044 TaxID=2940490 RepID=UPI002304570B|nr:hypothetical protein [Acidovorax sp. NCPPB 4044]MDA8522306.1 hypothetical protein [Acidovorax sp. NCPPB 4044]
MSALGSLVVSLGLDYAQFTGGMDKSEQAALAASKRIQDTMDGLKTGLATTAGAIAGGLAAGFTIAAFKGILTGAIETGAALDDLRMQTGATVESLSALMAVGKFNNMGPEQIGSAMNKLASNLAGATEESKGTGKAIEALGLDFDKFKSMRPEDQMQAVAKAMSEFEDGTGKSAVAMALYGKQGAAMLPFLTDLASVGELQAKVTTEQAAAAANLDDNLTRLSTSGDAWKKELANGMIPALDLGAQALLDVMNGAGGMRDEVRRLAADGSIARWTKDAITGLTYVADAATYVIRGVKLMAESLGAYAAAGAAYFGGVGEAVGKVLRGDFGGALDSLRAGASQAGAIVKDLGDSVAAAFNEETLGSRIRARMGEIESTGSVAEKARGKLDFTNVLEQNTKASKEAKEPIDALLDSINKRTSANQLELASGEKLTEADKTALEVLEQLRTGKVKLKADEAALIGVRLQEMYASEKQVIAHREEQKQLEAARVERLKMAQTLEQALSPLTEQNKTLRDEIELIGLTEAGQLAIIRARNASTIATKEATLAELERQAAISGTMTREQIALQAEIVLLKERNDLLGIKFDRTAIAKAVEEQAGAWKDAVKQYDDIFRQGFADMLNSGGSSWKSFTKSLATTFKTTVADTLYKAFAQPFVVRIVGQLLGLTGGVGGVAGAVSGGTSLTGGLGNVSSLLGIGGGSFGMGLNAGFGALFGEAGLFGALDAGSIAMGAGNILGGLGTIAGALGPIALGIGALVSLAGSFKGETRVGGQFGVSYNGEVTNQRRGQTYTYEGQQYDRDFSNGQRVALTDGQAYRMEGDPVAQEDAIRKAVSGTAQSIGDMLKALGSQVTVAGFWAGLETSEKGRGGVFAGGLLSNGARFGESGQGDNYAGTLYEKFSTNSPDLETALGNFALDLKQGTIQALQSVTDIPDTIKKMIDVDAEALTGEAVDALLLAINAQITGVTQFKASLKSMGLDGLAAMSFDAAAGIAELSGGFTQLQSNLSSYYQNFFSEEEQKANLQEQLRKQLATIDIELPDIDASDARAQYRALIDAQDENTEEGRKAIAMLLQLSGAFAGLTKEAADSAAAEEDAARRKQEIADTRWDLEQRLLIAQGKEQEALELRRWKEYYALQALDPAMALLATTTWAAEDAAKAAAEAERQRQEAQAEAERKHEEAEAAARGKVDKAYAALERATEAQRKVLEVSRTAAAEAVSMWDRVVDIAHGAVVALRGEVTSTAAMQAAQGWVFIEDAVQRVLAGGQGPDSGSLTEAIAAARGGLNANNYATQYELDRDRLILAGQLATLEAAGGKQLTAAQQQQQALEQQIQLLDDQLDYWKEQIALSRGEIEATLSVAQALRDLRDAMVAPIGDNTKAPVRLDAPADGGASWGGGTGGAQVAQPARYNRVVSYGTAGVGYEPVIDQAVIDRLDGLAPVYHAFDGTGDLRGLLAAVQAAGGTLNDLHLLSGYFESDWVKAAASVGIPAFAAGGDHLGGWAVVGEQGPELAYMPPARIYTASDTRSMLRTGGQIAGPDVAEVLQRIALGISQLGEKIDGGNTSRADIAEMLERSFEGYAFRMRPVSTT